jgi:hypothetical protein
MQPGVRDAIRALGAVGRGRVHDALSRSAVPLALDIYGDNSGAPYTIRVVDTRAELTAAGARDVLHTTERLWRENALLLVFNGCATAHFRDDVLDALQLQ